MSNHKDLLYECGYGTVFDGIVIGSNVWGGGIFVDKVTGNILLTVRNNILTEPVGYTGFIALLSHTPSAQKHVYIYNNTWNGNALFMDTSQYAPVWGADSIHIFNN